MSKKLDTQKQYMVSGILLKLIFDIASLYDEPNTNVVQKLNGEVEYHITPFPNEKRDYLIGRLVQEFENMEWEEV